MIPEAELLLSITQNIINNKTSTVTPYNNIDWKILAKLLSYHEMVSFVYPFFKNSPAPSLSKLIDLLQHEYMVRLTSTLYLWKEFLLIFDAFTQASIPLVPIKGIAFMAELYNHNYFRQMADIDVLVAKNNLPQTQEILSALGYKKNLANFKEEYWLTKQCHLSFIKKGLQEFPLIVDVHFNLDFERPHRVILPKLWDRLRKIEAENRSIPLLSPEDTLFSLALHLRRRGKPLCLKNIIDLVLILNKFRDSFDWGYVLKEAGDGRMCSSVFFLLLQVKLFFDVDIPNMVWRGLKVPAYKKLIIKAFIKKYTFSLSFIEKASTESYLKSHFLLYDNFWEPIEYILHIPIEQFAAYYALNPYDKKTLSCYRNRLLYMPYRIFYKNK